MFLRAFFPRETDWLFSTEAGSVQLAESAGFERLVVVTLHRNHKYQNMEQVKEEVSAKALDLSQDGLPAGKKVLLVACCSLCLLSF